MIVSTNAQTPDQSGNVLPAPSVAPRVRMTHHFFNDHVMVNTYNTAISWFHPSHAIPFPWLICNAAFAGGGKRMAWPRPPRLVTSNNPTFDPAYPWNSSFYRLMAVDDTGTDMFDMISTGVGELPYPPSRVFGLRAKQVLTGGSRTIDLGNPMLILWKVFDAHGDEFAFPF